MSSTRSVIDETALEEVSELTVTFATSIPKEWGELEARATELLRYGRDEALGNLTLVAKAVHGRPLLDPATAFAVGWLYGQGARKEEIDRLTRIGELDQPPSAEMLRILLDQCESHVRHRMREASIVPRTQEGSGRRQRDGLVPRPGLLDALKEAYAPGMFGAACLLLGTGADGPAPAAIDALLADFLDGAFCGLSTALPEENEARPSVERATATFEADFEKPRLYGEFVFASSEDLISASLWVDPCSASLVLPDAGDERERSVGLSMRARWRPHEPDVQAAGARLLQIAQRRTAAQRAQLRRKASAVLCGVEAQRLRRDEADFQDSRNLPATYAAVQARPFVFDEYPLFVPPKGLAELLDRIRKFKQEIHAYPMSTDTDPTSLIGRIARFAEEMFALGREP